jgi:hypothetical protein
VVEFGKNVQGLVPAGAGCVGFAGGEVGLAEVGECVGLPVAVAQVSAQV